MGHIIIDCFFELAIFNSLQRENIRSFAIIFGENEILTFRILDGFQTFSSQMKITICQINCNHF